MKKKTFVLLMHLIFLKISFIYFIELIELGLHTIKVKFELV